MILHVALYRFHSDVKEEQIAQFMRELAASTDKTGLASRYFGGRHVYLPADDAVRDIVYDFAAIWVFANQTALDEFSRHPVMVNCVATSVRPLVKRLAITNFVGLSDAMGNPSGVEEKQYAF